jgi:hypothetical protein
MNNKDEETLRGEIQASLKQARISQTVFLAVLEVLAQFEGKTINKRIETQLKKALPERVFSVEKHILGSYELKTWGKDLPYDQKLYIRLSPSQQTDNRLSMEFIRDYNRPWYIHTDRLDSMEKALQKLQGWIAKREAIRGLEAGLKEEMGKYYQEYLFSN